MMAVMIDCAPGSVDVWQWPGARLEGPTHSSADVLARVLSQYLDCEPRDVSLARGPRGKPRLAMPSASRDLRFNMSNSFGSVVIAVTVGRQVGIDLEAGIPADRVEALVHYYTRGEQLLLAAVPGGPKRIELLRRLWVAKEALLNATGEGITPAFRTLDLSAAAGGATLVLQRPLVGEDVPRTWTVQPLTLRELAYPAALAVEGSRPAELVLRNSAADGG